VVAMGNRFPEQSLLVVAAVVLAAAGIPQSLVDLVVMDRPVQR